MLSILIGLILLPFIYVCKAQHLEQEVLDLNTIDNPILQEYEQIQEKASECGIMSRILSTISRVSKTPKWGGFAAIINPPYESFDPFIFLVQHTHSFQPSERSGFPSHPHRGFETVTYAVEGGFEHGDSRGNKGTYENGDVQWMTAGKGVLHNEMFLTNKSKPSRFHGFQLWVNLPAKLKMCEPDYQMLWAKDIPKYKSPDNKIEVVIIAGEYGGLKASVNKSTPMTYLHVKLQKNASFQIPFPANYNCLVYVFEGTGWFGPADNKKKVESLTYGLFANEGNLIEAENQQDNTLEFLLIGGKPFNEPFAHHGPFVMNTQAELMQAFRDYQAGTFGHMDDED